MATPMIQGELQENLSSYAVEVFICRSRPRIHSLNGDASGATRFNDNSYAFDPLNPPFHYDTTSSYGDGPYFSDYYTWSRGNGTLSAFSSRIYCAELKG